MDSKRKADLIPDQLISDPA